MKANRFTAVSDGAIVYDVAEVEQQLDDVIELSDPLLIRFQLNELNLEGKEKVLPTIDVLRIGIFLHEAAAMALSNGSLTEAYNLASQSQCLLVNLNLASPPKEMKPIIYVYASSSQILIGLASKRFTNLVQGLSFFNRSVNQFKDRSLLPEYLRAKAFLNLLWYFFSRKKKAKRDLNSIIARSHQKSKPFNPRIISFSYLHMARLVREENSKTDVHSIIELLNKAITWDPNRAAARDKAEIMKTELMREYKLKK